MNKNDLLNTETNKLINKEVTRNIAINAYVIFSVFAMMILTIFICTKQHEINLLKGKAHNDSLAVQRLNDNLLKPR